MKSRIGYEFAKGEAGMFKTFNAIENKENSWELFTVSNAEVQQACALAEVAAVEFQSYTETQRASFLIELVNELEINRADLIEMYISESNLSSTRANTELNRTKLQLELLADYILGSSFKEEQSTSVSQNKTFQRKWRGLGPIVVFGASNFPFAYSTLGGDTAAAFAAGCPVIVKAHPYHAGTSWMVSELIIKVAQKQGLPNGVFSHLLSDGFECGVQLLKSTEVKGVGFTGSTKGGEALLKLASEREEPIPVFAEMGSLNPVVFFESGLEDVEKWSSEFSKSIATDAGQFCTKPGLLFVPDSKKGIEFITELEKYLKKEAPRFFVHPNIYSAFKEKVSSQFEWINAPNLCAQPTVRKVSISEFCREENYREEYFGPQAIVISYGDEETLLKGLNKLKGQLTFTLISEEKELFFKKVENLAISVAGRIIYNDVPTGVLVLPEMVHGGVYPASSDSRFTAVGPKSIYRFLRPVVLQNKNN